MKNIVTVIIFLIISSFDVNDNKWIPLLDKDFSQWEKYLSYQHKTTYHGEVPKDEKGIDITPIGFNKDDDSIFSVIVKDHDLILRVKGKTYGCIFTKQEFENYHLKLKVKWGEQKYEPRTNKLRDTGIIYHSIGACGVDYWRSWMLGQELQIMEGHMGDYWNIAGAAIDVRAFIPEGVMNPIASNTQPFLALGTDTDVPGFCLRSENQESTAGEWTTIELICWRGKSLHIVNGHVVMVLQNSRYSKEGKSIPLTKGKIQIQSEAAEVFYKDIMIKNITALPKVYSYYFN